MARLIGVAFCLAQGAYAQELDPLELERPALELGRQEIDSSLPLTALDLLRGISGALVTRSNAEGSVFLRGLSGPRVGLDLDGFRFNGDLALLDPYAADRVRIRPGASVERGDLAGTLEISSRQARTLRTDSSLQVDETLRASSGDEGLAGHLGLGGRFGEIGLRAAATLLRVGGLRTGDDVVDFSGWRSRALDFAAGAHIGKGQQFRIAHHNFSLMDAPLLERSSASTLALVREAKSEMTYARYSGKQIEIGMAFQEVSRRTEIAFFDEDRFAERAEETRGIGGFAQATIEALGTRLALGAEVYRNGHSSDARGEFLSTGDGAPGEPARLPTGSEQLTIEPYAFDSVDLGRRIRLGAGARLHVAALSIPSRPEFAPIDRHYVGGTGEARLRYRLGDFALLAALTHAFRPPSLEELGGLGCTSEGFSVPAPGLDAEKSIAAEGTVIADLAGFLRGSLTYSTSWIRDFISRSPAESSPSDVCGLEPVPTFAPENASALIHALDLDVRWLGSAWWSLYGRGSLSHDVRDVVDVSPAFAGLGAALHSPSRSWFVDASVDAAASPGAFLVASLGAGARIVSGVELVLRLRNLSDEDYRTHGSAQHEPGFRAIVGLVSDWGYP